MDESYVEDNLQEQEKKVIVKQTDAQKIINSVQQMSYDKAFLESRKDLVMIDRLTQTEDLSELLKEKQVEENAPVEAKKSKGVFSWKSDWRRKSKEEDNLKKAKKLTDYKEDVEVTGYTVPIFNAWKKYNKKGLPSDSNYGPAESVNKVIGDKTGGERAEALRKWKLMMKLSPGVGADELENPKAVKAFNDYAKKLSGNFDSEVESLKKKMIDLRVDSSIFTENYIMEHPEETMKELKTITVITEMFMPGSPSYESLTDGEKLRAREFANVKEFCVKAYRATAWKHGLMYDANGNMSIHKNPPVSLVETHMAASVNAETNASMVRQLDKITGRKARLNRVVEKWINEGDFDNGKLQEKAMEKLPWLNRDYNNAAIYKAIATAKKIIDTHENTERYKVNKGVTEKLFRDLLATADEVNACETRLEAMSSMLTNGYALKEFEDSDDAYDYVDKQIYYTKMEHHKLQEKLEALQQGIKLALLDKSVEQLGITKNQLNILSGYGYEELGIEEITMRGQSISQGKLAVELEEEFDKLFQATRERTYIGMVYLKPMSSTIGALMQGRDDDECEIILTLNEMHENFRYSQDSHERDGRDLNLIDRNESEENDYATYLENYILPEYDNAQRLYDKLKDADDETLLENQADLIRYTEIMKYINSISGDYLLHKGTVQKQGKEKIFTVKDLLVGFDTTDRMEWLRAKEKEFQFDGLVSGIKKLSERARGISMLRASRFTELDKSFLKEDEKEFVGVVGITDYAKRLVAKNGSFN